MEYTKKQTSPINKANKHSPKGSPDVILIARGNFILCRFWFLIVILSNVITLFQDAWDAFISQDVIIIPQYSLTENIKSQVNQLCYSQ